MPEKEESDKTTMQESSIAGDPSEDHDERHSVQEDSGIFVDSILQRRSVNRRRAKSDDYSERGASWLMNQKQLQLQWQYRVIGQTVAIKNP